MAKGGDNFEMENVISGNGNDTDPVFIPPKDDGTDDFFIDESFNSEHLSLPPYVHTQREIDRYDFDPDHEYLFGEDPPKKSFVRRAIDKIKSYWQDSEYREIDGYEMEDSSLWSRVKGSSKFSEIRDKFGKFKTDLPKELRKKLGESFRTKLQRNKFLNDEAVRRQNILRQENEEDLKRYNRLHDEETDDLNNKYRRGNEIQKRIAGRGDQIKKIQIEIDKRNEEDMKIIDRLPMPERVREIFKKYGLTAASILLAIWAVVSTIIAAIQPGAESGGEKIEKKTTVPSTRLNKSIPIGAVTDFIFDAALDVIEELVENSWLLIELLVIFYIGKR